MANVVYIPGVCNIGPVEIRSRQRLGIAGLALTIIFFILAILLSFPPALRLIVIVPGAMAATGYLQAWMHFCVRFGTTGLFNVGDTLGKTESVDQKDYRRKDQRKAISIIALSLLIGVAIGLLLFFL
jgi:VIT1/CCC1 family predicted Fe2+/Mn2+ transporter